MRTQGRLKNMAATDGTPLAATVIVCAYTVARWETTKAAVASVLRQRPPPAQVLVVIDHNPELEARARAELTDVEIVASVGERGLSGARNTGLGRATQPIAVFLDDDAEARDGWLVALVEPYDDVRVAATGGGVWPRWARS